MGSQLYAMLSGLPDQYAQGQKQAFDQTQRQRTLSLQQPILGPDGQPSMDYSTLLRGYLTKAGAEAVPGLLSGIIGSQSNQAIYNQLGQGGAQGAPAGYSVPASGGGNPSPGQPRLSSAGADNNGAQTINSLASEVFGDRDVSALLPRYAAAVGNVPGEPLTPDQEAKARTYMTRTAKDFAGRMPSYASSPGQSADDAASDGNGRNAAPFMASGAGGGAPAPTGGSQAPFGQQYSQASGPATPVGNEAQAQAYEARGRRSMAASALYGASPQAAAAAQKAAEDDFARAKAIRETSARYAEPTGPMKESRDPNVLARDVAKGIETHRTEDSFKRYAAIEKAGGQAEDLHPQIAMARSLVNSPGFNAGAGKPFADVMSRLGSTLFGDPKMATPGEFFDKLRAGSILNEIRGLGGSGAGPVRVAEMKFIDTMYAGRDMQPASIRAVVEIENRLTQRTKALYNLAQDYVQQHGRLDEGFNRQVTAFKDKHEMFSKAELANPGLLSMPVFSSPAEMQQSRMPRGTQFRRPDGQIGVIP
jgi:hypothetical protein